MKKAMLAVAFLLLGGCGPHLVGGARVPDSGAVVVSGGPGAGRNAKRARSVHVPPGHYPPPGQCRIWYVGVPPGHQPRPSDCGSLVRRVPRGAFLLYNEKAWDTEYDWRSYDRSHPHSVPEVVLRIMASVRVER